MLYSPGWKDFIKLKIKSSGLHLEKNDLLELQEDVKNLFTKDWWHSVTSTKLEDCNNDKKRILQSLIKILEREYDAPVIIDFDNDTSESKKETEIDDDLEDFEDDKKSSFND